MAKILVVYHSDASEVTYDAMCDELLKNGNDIFRFNVSNTNFVCYSCWGGENHLVDANLLSDISNFNPEIVLNFNNSAPIELMKTISGDCKICVIDADNPELFWNKKYLSGIKNRFYYLGIQSGSLTLFQRFIAENIKEGKNYLFSPMATGVKNEKLEVNKNITFIGTNFLWPINQVYIPKEFYEEDGLIVYKQFEKNYYSQSPDILKLLKRKYTPKEASRLLGEVKHYFCVQDRLKSLSILVPLGLTIYGTNWRNSAFWDFSIATSYNDTTVSTLADNQRVYNTSKISVNISHPQAITSFSWRVMDIMASASCLLMEKKTDWYELFGKYISKPVKDSILYNDRFDMYLKAKRLLEDEKLRRQCVSELNGAIEKNGRWEHRFKAIEDFLSIRIINVGSKKPYYRFVQRQQQQQQQQQQNKIKKRIKAISYSLLLVLAKIPCGNLLVSEKSRKKLQVKLLKYKK